MKATFFLFFLFVNLFADDWQVDTSADNLVHFHSTTTLLDFEGSTSNIDGYAYWEGSKLFGDNNEIYFLSEILVIVGPFNYSMVNNRIEFNNISYDIEIVDCNHMRFVNSNYNIMFEKIELTKPISRNELWDGFFLRKCVYLLNKGLLSYKEAYDTLKAYNYNEFDDVIEDEELVPISSDLNEHSMKKP